MDQTSSVMAFFVDYNNFAGTTCGVIVDADTNVDYVEVTSMVDVFEALGRHVEGMAKGFLMSSIIFA